MAVAPSRILSGCNGLKEKDPETIHILAEYSVPFGKVQHQYQNT